MLPLRCWIVGASGVVGCLLGSDRSPDHNGNAGAGIRRAGDLDLQALPPGIYSVRTEQGSRTNFHMIIRSGSIGY